MSRTRIVTDSTAYITDEFICKNNIGIVPLTIFFEDKSFNEPTPGKFDSFYESLKTSKDFPKTSQPSVQAFIQVFEEAVSKGEEIIVITISSKLSGTFNSANIAAQNTAPDKIAVVDSMTSGPCLRFLVEKALELSQQGKGCLEIKEILEIERDRHKAVFTVGTLDYLKKGGRLSNAQAFIGTLLNIKPIIALADGVLTATDKVRGKNKAVEAIIESIPSNANKISIVHIQNLEEANKLKEELTELFPNAVFSIDELGPVLGSHLGPMAIGACFQWV